MQLGLNQNTQMWLLQCLGLLKLWCLGSESGHLRKDHSEGNMEDGEPGRRNVGSEHCCDPLCETQSATPRWHFPPFPWLYLGSLMLSLSSLTFIGTQLCVSLGVLLSIVSGSFGCPQTAIVYIMARGVNDVKGLSHLHQASRAFVMSDSENWEWLCHQVCGKLEFQASRLDPQVKVALTCL